MDYSTKKLIVIVGPTAVGKTDVSIYLAKHFRAEIISADSRQFFRELKIGTAKPSAKQLSEVPHHFINSLSIVDDYDAARFAEEALALIYKRFKELDYLIVCGGSGLYLKALLNGFDDIPEIPASIREEILVLYNEEGLAWLQQKLKALDPEYFGLIDQQNPARLMRALEVAMGTGKSITSFQKKKKRELPFKVVQIGMELDREELYKRIDDRMTQMIDAGLFNEAQELFSYRQHNALQTVGYSEIFEFMEGKFDKQEAIRLLKRNSRRYAKRQLTWFKKDNEIRWFEPHHINEIVQYIKND